MVPRHAPSRQERRLQTVAETAVSPGASCQKTLEKTIFVGLQTTMSTHRKKPVSKREYLYYTRCARLWRTRCAQAGWPCECAVGHRMHTDDGAVEASEGCLPVS
jgi:hypothetical protein